jgi:hypothetical protein
MPAYPKRWMSSTEGHRHITLNKNEKPKAMVCLTATNGFPKRKLWIGHLGLADFCRRGRIDFRYGDDS